MPVESSHGRGATRNPTPTRFNLKERAVEGDWHRHARAARAIAEEYFDSRKIVSRIVEQAATARPAIPSGGVIGVSF